MAVTMSKPSVNAIPDGDYLGKVGLITFGVSRKGDPQIVIAITILGNGGVSLGGKTARLTNSPKSVLIFAEALRHLGFNQKNFQEMNGSRPGTKIRVRLRTNMIPESEIMYQNCEILGPTIEKSQAEDLGAAMLASVGAFLDEGDEIPKDNNEDGLNEDGLNEDGLDDVEVNETLHEVVTQTSEKPSLESIPEKASRKPTEKKKKSKVVEVEQEEDIPY